MPLTSQSSSIPADPLELLHLLEKQKSLNSLKIPMQGYRICYGEVDIHMLIALAAMSGELTKLDGGPCDCPEVSEGQEKHLSCDMAQLKPAQALT